MAGPNEQCEYVYDLSASSLVETKTCRAALTSWQTGWIIAVASCGSHDKSVIGRQIQLFENQRLARRSHAGGTAAAIVTSVAKVLRTDTKPQFVNSVLLRNVFVFFFETADTAAAGETGLTAVTAGGGNAVTTRKASCRATSSGQGRALHFFLSIDGFGTAFSIPTIDDQCRVDDGTRNDNHFGDR